MSFLVRRWWGLVVLAAGLSIGLLTTAYAWVSSGFQTFPDGEAPVIVDPFCMSEYCGALPREAWRDRVLRAMAAWNTANTGFTFSEVAESFSNTPCNEYDGISIILTDGEVCPGDPSMGGLGYFVPTRHERARVYINIGEDWGDDYTITPLLIHELGHALGLGYWPTLTPDSLLSARTA